MPTPQRRKPSSERAYRVFQPHLKVLCRAFARRCGGWKYWEILSEANEAFADLYRRWEPAKGKLIPYMRDRVWKRLQDNARKVAVQERVLPRLEGEDGEKALAAVEARPEVEAFSIKRFSWSARPRFRKDVRTVLDVLFHGPYLALPSARPIRSAVIRHLRNDRGWTRHRVYAVFAQIQQALYSED